MAARHFTTPLAMIKKYAKFALHRYRKLHLLGKLFIWMLLFFYMCMGVFIIVVTPSRIAQFMYDKTRLLAATRFGWLILLAALIGVSFPPLIGHTTLVTLGGFAYGMEGFFISAAGSLIGSALVFMILRLVFSKKLHTWSSQNQKWQALESVVTSKGLLLIILIRISPFPPWVYSNSLFASIEAVKLWQFVIATTCVFPKILLHTFIGNKMAELSDGDQRGHMDTRTKVLDVCFVIGGIIIAIFTSWTVYNLVQNHIRHLEGIPPEVDELAAEAIEDYDEEAPLLSPNEG
ncbi:Golgi apparatus membrane protein TVP38 [Pholiota conissans]|uniref:Golgi apparatus membrane protein TVP38 n=1 Tax=Pholiota conissans TaxID=109636 RepID=A0A9P5Z7N1_9AGAR|nr:Golgi apparatus membrane protein TVP38 [Pholiota conissans]